MEFDLIGALRLFESTLHCSPDTGLDTKPRALDGSFRKLGVLLKGSIRVPLKGSIRVL